MTLQRYLDDVELQQLTAAPTQLIEYEGKMEQTPTDRAAITRAGYKTAHTVRALVP